jgi:DNA-binding LacI/PurR family transcriptional regulator
LKKDGHVREDIRQQVLEVAQRLGYRPHLAARTLKTGQSFEIAAVVGSLDELHMEKMFAFEHVLRSAGYSVHILFGPHEAVNDLEADRVLRVLTAQRPAAAAIFPQSYVSVAKAVAQFDLLRIPYVVLDSLDEGTDHVSLDRQQGVFESVNFLISRGRRNIAYLGYTSDCPGDFVSRRTRLDGYERAMRASGLPQRILSVEPHVSESDGGREAIEAFLAARPRPDAVQVYTDDMAAAFLASLHERGIRVPEEVAVVGFDNRRVAQLCWPRLTTVSQANQEVGAAAADVLLGKIAGKPPPQEGWSRSLPAKLIVRETT